MAGCVSFAYISLPITAKARIKAPKWGLEIKICKKGLAPIVVVMFKELWVFAIKVRFDHNAKHPKNPLGSESSRRGIHPTNAVNPKILPAHLLGERIVLGKSLRRIISTNFPVSPYLP